MSAVRQTDRQTDGGGRNDVGCEYLTTGWRDAAAGLLTAVRTAFRVSKKFVPKVCRYNWHSAGSLGWPFPVLKYKCHFSNEIDRQKQFYQTTSEVEIGKMLIAV